MDSNDEIHQADTMSRPAQRPRRTSREKPRQSSREQLAAQVPQQATQIEQDMRLPEAQQSRRDARSRQASRGSPADPPVSLQPSQRDRNRKPYWIRRKWTWLQRLGGVLIAGACVAGAAWYVPRVVSADQKLLTGTVTSGGVVTLNFTYVGEISKIYVRPNQWVRKGQVLATEYNPNAGSVVAADKLVIASEQAKITQLKADEVAYPPGAPVDNVQISADKAQLAVDEVQLATDRQKVAAMEIVAPSSGEVIAANGQPGETVSPAGIRYYATDSQQPSTVQGPEFSLIPQGPQTVRHVPASQLSLPVITLRVSATWQVVALVPEDSVSGIRPGQQVTISVPSAHITDVAGQIGEVLPTPASTPEGVFYQAVVAITGHARGLPMDGMAADIRLGS
jgi:multidrug efflux pump subunit AcrA (membrane-fusion protein)